MPTLKEYRDVYYSASAKAGDISRQLGLAAIAIIWIFKITSTGAGTIFYLPRGLDLPLTFVIFAMIFDLLQYIYKALIWGAFTRYHEWKNGPDTNKEYIGKTYFNWPSLFFFWGKLFLILIAYLFLIKFMWNVVIFR